MKNVHIGQFNPSYSKFKIGARLSSRLGPSLSFIQTRIISVIFSFTKFNFFYSRVLIGQQTFKAKNILPSEEEKILKLFFFQFQRKRRLSKILKNWNLKFLKNRGEFGGKVRMHFIILLHFYAFYMHLTQKLKVMQHKLYRFYGLIQNNIT